MGVPLVAAGFGILALGTLLLALAFSVARPASPTGWLALLVRLAGGRGEALAAGALVLCALFAAVALGLLRGRPWARAGALAAALVGILANAVRLGGGDLDGLLGALVFGGLAYYLFRPEVRAWFARA